MTESCILVLGMTESRKIRARCMLIVQQLYEVDSRLYNSDTSVREHQKTGEFISISDQITFHLNSLPIIIK